MADDAALRTSADLTVRNASRIRPMLWIGFYTTLLNILTLTIFRFWGRTQFRERLWQETTIGGEPLHYTGRGVELFIGFVVAIFSLMLPVLALSIGAQLLLGPIGASIIPSIIYLLVSMLFGVAVFFARRYHLSRTRFRGIRFAQSGSGWSYGIAAFGYLLIGVVTLGWYAPAARLKLSRRLWNNAYYGSARFSFDDTQEAKAEPVYQSFAAMWFGVAFSVLIPFLGVMLVFSGAENLPLEEGQELPPELGLIPLALLVVFAFSVGIFGAWHRAVMNRRIAKSLSIDGARLSSRYSTGDALWLTISNFMLIAFTFGFGAMAAQMRGWKRIANRLSLSGSINFEAIRQAADKGPVQGEGLADGLDIASNF